MRLLIDEMYPPAIAVQLRERGHEAEAATERAELRGLADSDLFALAQKEQRAVVAENISDFSDVASAHDQRGQLHHGLILVAPSSYPRGSPGMIGLMVTELDRLLGEHPDTTPIGLRLWL